MQRGNGCFLPMINTDDSDTQKPVDASNVVQNKMLCNSLMAITHIGMSETLKISVISPKYSCME